MPHNLINLSPCFHLQHLLFPPLLSLLYLNWLTCLSLFPTCLSAEINHPEGPFQSPDGPFPSLFMKVGSFVVFAVPWLIFFFFFFFYFLAGASWEQAVSGLFAEVG